MKALLGKIRWWLINLLISENDKHIMKSYAYDYSIYMQGQLLCGKDYHTQEKWIEDRDSFINIFRKIKIKDQDEYYL